jgi:hypothetical protein
MSTTRVIRKFKLIFPNHWSLDNLWQFEKILHKFGPWVTHLTLQGVLFDNELMLLLKFVPNCKDLNLTEFCVINTLDDVHHLNLPKMMHLTINEDINDWLSEFIEKNGSSKFEFLDRFRLPENCLTTVWFTTSFDGNFQALNRFLTNQTKIDEFWLNFEFACNCIPDDFLNHCCLQKMTVNFSLCNSHEVTQSGIEVMESIERFRGRQISLKVANITRYT